MVMVIEVMAVELEGEQLFALSVAQTLPKSTDAVRFV